MRGIMIPSAKMIAVELQQMENRTNILQSLHNNNRPIPHPDDISNLQDAIDSGLTPMEAKLYLQEIKLLESKKVDPCLIILEIINQN